MQDTHQQELENSNLNLKEIIENYLTSWKWILLSIIICSSITYVYLRYKNPIFQSTATVLIKDSKSNNTMPGLSALSNLGFETGSRGLENETELLKSRTLLGKVSRNLNLSTKTTIIGHRSGIERFELYKTSPFKINTSNIDSTLFKATEQIKLTINSSTEFEIHTNQESEIHKFGESINIEIGSIKFSKTAFFDDNSIDQSFIVYLTPEEQIVTALKNTISVSPINKDADILLLSIKGPVSEKNNDILKELIKQHKINTLKNKNEVAENTNTFLTKRLEVIEEQLNQIEEIGKDYKTANSLTDLETDGQTYIRQKSRIEEEVTKAEIQSNLSKYMISLLENYDRSSNTLLPANLGFEDLSINKTTDRYNELVLKKSSLLEVSSSINPSVLRINAELESLINSLDESLKGLETRIKVELEILNKQEKQFNNKIASLPKYEQEFRDIKRQQEIKESLYLFLLEKKEENEISMASNVSNSQTIDEPYCDKTPVSPKKKIIYLAAIFLGALIPIGVIYVTQLLDTKVKSIEEIESLQLPNVGSIPEASDDDKLISKDNLRTSIAEAYRILRSNINFLTEKNTDKGQIIFVTSTIAGEGKTITSLNIAQSLAFTDKKVLIIGLDLRKPKLLEYFDLEQGKGVSDFLVSDDPDFERYIQKPENHKNLHFLSSGSIPPNPSELLLKDKLQDLFNSVREEYDYVIVDTAPSSLVVDTVSISKYADLVLYVVRANYLDKRMLNIPQNFYSKKSLGNMAIVLNGVKNNSKSYNYGYGYGYGVETKKVWYKSLLFWKK